ncbi:PDZ and LIM domain protein 5-like isoform X2 [Nelusetta ayraudi]|uniref:PDZ and LIM domain protein 5-like isoform X2 n=1 Tax=Nelusetta ayraudi TaxID=303726 RepID=UPI003F7247FB
MSSSYSVTLHGPAPWGFRLQGGKDFNLPLAISRLTDGGKAARGGISVGDLVVSIDGITTDGMNHLEAQNKIKSCSGNLSLTLHKASSAPKPPPVAPKDNRSDIIKPVALTRPPPPPHHPHHPGPTASPAPALYSKAPRPCGVQHAVPPFIPSPSSAFAPPAPPPAHPLSPHSSPPVLVPPQPSVYNTPIHLYSADNACEVAMGQRRGLLEGRGLPEGQGPLENRGGASPPHLNGVPRKHIVDTDIHFYHVPTHADASRKRITEDTEDWRPRTGTTQSRSFRILAQITGTENVQAEESDSAKKNESSLAKYQEEVSLPEPNPAGGAASSSSPACFPLAPVESPFLRCTNCPVTPLRVSTGSENVTFGEPWVKNVEEFHEQTTLALEAGGVRNDSSTEKSAPVPLTTVPAWTPHKKQVRRELLLKPLDFLPRAAPRPPCLTSSAPQTVAPRTHNEGCSPEQARTRPESWLSPSLLDALLISPLAEIPRLGLRRRTKRRSASDLRLPRNKRVSWHQSSTSAGEPLFSSPVNAVYVFSEDVEEPNINGHESAVVKTMFRAPAAAQGRGPQTGVVTPSFTMKGSGSAGVQQGLVPARPVPQPHPGDQDTLVQMAEHIPAGTRTPMCGHCNMVIRGPFLVAMGRSWHKEEFNCAHCRSSLAHTGFVEEKGSVYCEHCYEEFLAPSCSRCQAKILGEVISALKQSWHVYCFLCACCQQPIRNNTFHLEDGEPYCEQDFYNLFGTGCHGCEFPIEAGDKFLEALGHIWHDNCFVCAVCCTSLEGQTFFSKKDKPLCKKHAHTLKI